MGVGKVIGGDGLGGGRTVEMPPPYLLVFLCHAKLWSGGFGGTHGKPSLERVSTVCTHSLPAHMYVPHIQNTGRRYNTLHAPLLPLDCFVPALLTVLSESSDKAALYFTSHRVSVPPHISVSSPLSLSLFSLCGIVSSDIHSHHSSNLPQAFFPLRGIVMTAEQHLQPSPCLTSPRQSWAELERLVVNNKSLFRQSQTAGTLSSSLLYPFWPRLSHFTPTH